MVDEFQQQLSQQQQALNRRRSFLNRQSTLRTTNPVQRQQALREVSVAQQRLSEVQSQYNEDLRRVEDQNRRINNINNAIRLGLQGKGSSDAYRSLSRSDRDLVNSEIKRIEDSAERSGIRQATRDTIEQVEQRLQRSLGPTERAQIESEIRSGATQIALPRQPAERFLTPQTLQQNGRFELLSGPGLGSGQSVLSGVSSRDALSSPAGSRNNNLFVSQVREVPAPQTVFERAQAFLSRTGSRTFGQVTPERGVLGVASSILSGAEFLTRSNLRPIETAKSIKEGIRFKAASGEPFFANVGERLRADPAFATGFALGEIAQFGAGSLAGSQLLRAIPSTTRTAFVTEDVLTSGDDIFFKSAAVTTRTTPFTQQNILTGGVTQVRRIPIDETTEGFRAGTLAVSRRDRGFDLIRQRNILDDPVGVSSIETGEIVRTPIRTQFPSILASDEGAAFRGVGKTATQGQDGFDFFISGGTIVPMAENELAVIGRSSRAVVKNGKLVPTGSADPFFGKSILINEAALDSGTSSLVLRRGSGALAKTRTEQAIQKAVQQQLKQIEQASQASARISSRAGSGATSLTRQVQEQRQRQTQVQRQNQQQVQTGATMLTMRTGTVNVQTVRPAQASILRAPTATAQSSALRVPSLTTPVTRGSSRTRTVFRVVTPVPPRGTLSEQSRENLRSAVAKIKSWDVYVKSKGKYRKIADNLPRNLAEKTGADYVLNKIETRFKLVGDKKGTKKKDINYEPDPAVFRNYLIRKGMRVPLADEWIQKAGTRAEPTVRGARLRSRGERASIRRSRGFGGNINWFA